MIQKLLKYRVIWTLLVLTALWWFFFGFVKFYLWTTLAEMKGPSLELIAGYLSFWSIFAYAVGWMLAYAFKDRYLLIVAWISAFSALVFGYVFDVTNSVILAVMLSILWFMFWISSIIRSIIVATQIASWTIKDTTINAWVSIILVSWLIIWSWLGALLHEKFLWIGFIVLMLFSIVLILVPLFFPRVGKNLEEELRFGIEKYRSDRNEKLRGAFKTLIPNVKVLLYNYGCLLIISGLLRSLSSVISQKAIDYSVNYLWYSYGRGSLILLIGALWAMVGNILTIGVQARRWKLFMIYLLGYAIGCILVIFLKDSWYGLASLSFFIGACFWASANLLDSYYFAKIGELDQKEHGSSTYGFVAASMIASVMFLANYIEKYFWIDVIFGGCAVILLCIFLLFIIQPAKNKIL